VSRKTRAGVAVALAGVAVLLLLLAADFRSVESSLRSSDLAYREQPRRPDLWRPGQILPFAPARRLAGVADDVVFRRGVRLLRLSNATPEQYLDPALDGERGRAQIALTRVAVADEDVRRRAAAENYLGVIAFGSAIRDQTTRETFLVNATAAFQSAIRHDPSNSDAKYNLELALIWLQAVDFDNSTSSGGRRRGGFGTGAGAGSTGSGY
jgi:hypothetical protein